MNDFTEIDRMTLYEYDMRLKAYNLRHVDRDYEIHRQAWANWNVQAMKNQGKRKRVPVFRNFKQFFDYDEQLKAMMGNRGGSEKVRAIANIIRKQRKREEG